MKRRPIIYLSFAALINLSCVFRPAPTSVLIMDTQEQPAYVIAEADELLPTDSAVTQGTLENGLRYFIRVNHKPENRAELRLVVNAGSVLEDDDQQGLAHFVEHMAFNGTEHFAKHELVDFMELIGMRFGPEVNAYTGFDETVYMLTVPTDSVELMETAFQILEDWAQGLSFDPEEIDKERGVVIEEWRLGRGADARMRDQQFPVLFKDSQYAARLPIGQKAVIDSAHYETIKRFYQDWYRPDLMALVAVGDFDPDWIEGLIKNHFSGLKDKEQKRLRKQFPVPDHEENLVTIASDPEATHSRVSVYYKQDIEDERTHGAYRKSILVNLYNGMLNQRLLELTKKPQSPFLYGFSGQGRFVRTKDVYFLGAVVNDNGIENGLDALLVEAERVARYSFTTAELERQKMDMLRGMEKAYEERDKTESRRYAGEYVRHFLEDEPIPGIEYEYQLYQRYIPEIGVEAVNRLTRELLTDNNRVVLVNQPEKEELTIPNADSLLAIFTGIENLDLEPYQEELSDQPLVQKAPEPAEIVRTALHQDLEIEEWTLANGVRVLLKPTEFKNDEILFTAYSPGGHSLIDDEYYIAGITATSVVGEGGVGPFNAIDLDKKLAGKMVRVSPFIGGLQEGLSGSASPKDLETMFQLIYLYFTEPRKDSTAYLAYVERMIGFLENRSASPEVALRDTLQVTMSQYHFRSRPWTMDLLREMNLEKSYAFYRDRFADASDFTFVLVGNFSVDTVRNYIQTYLGGLPAINRAESWRDVGIDPPTGTITKKVVKGLEQKSRAAIVFSSPFEWNPQNRYELQSMVAVLRIKLREVLREDRGGTYGVRVSATTQHFPDEDCKIQVSFGCDPERVEELTSVVFEQIDSLKTFGTTEKYLTKVKESQLRKRETDLKENRFWLNMIKFKDFHSEDILDILNYEEQVNGLTSEAVKKAAQIYFNGQNIVQISLYPEGSNPQE